MRNSVVVFRVIAGALAIAGAGCTATSFQGDAKFPGGPRGCYTRCEEVGLEMESYVFVGEYSTGCVCSQPKKPTAPEGPASAAATGAAAVGVVIQMREAERQRQQASMQAGMFHPTPH